LGRLSDFLATTLGISTAGDALRVLPRKSNITYGQWPAWLETNADASAPRWRVWAGDQCMFTGDSEGEMDAFVLGLAVRELMLEHKAES
jgi:hypothetical protein